MLYIKIFATTPAAPVILPRAAYSVERYSKRAIGGPKDATISVLGDAAALASLRTYIGYGIHITNDQGAVVWWGYLEDISLSATEGRAQITCAGWWKKLAMRYYADSTGVFSFMDTSADKQSFSDSANILRVCGSFIKPSGSDWTITAVGVNLYVAGDPAARADTVRLDIYNDGAVFPDYTVPGATLLSTWSTYPSATVIGKNGGYVQYDLTTPVAYNTTKKWICLSATGSYSATDYYQAGVNTKKQNGYSQLVWYKDVDWHLGTSNGPNGNGPNGWMLFKLIGTLPTSTQIYNVLNATGDYNGIDIMSASGVSSCQYREGKEKCDAIVEDLLKTGDSGGTRYLIDVTPEKRVRVYTEPAAAISSCLRLTGATKIGYSIENLANRISAIYTTQKGASTGGTQAQTGWQEDAISQTRYGVREQIISLKDTDEAAAVNYVTTALGLLAYPQTKVEWDMGARVGIYTPYGGRVRPDTCPVGYWARVTDSVQAYLDSPFIKSASVIFVEEAEYDAESDSYTPTPRGSENDWQMFTFSG